MRFNLCVETTRHQVCCKWPCLTVCKHSASDFGSTRTYHLHSVHLCHGSVFLAQSMSKSCFYILCIHEGKSSFFDCHPFGDQLKVETSTDTSSKAGGQTMNHWWFQDVHVVGKLTCTLKSCNFYSWKATSCYVVRQKVPEAVELSSGAWVPPTWWFQHI